MLRGKYRIPFYMSTGLLLFFWGIKKKFRLRKSPEKISRPESGQEGDPGDDHERQMDEYGL